MCFYRMRKFVSLYFYLVLRFCNKTIKRGVFFVYYKKRETIKYASHNCITKVKFHGYGVDMVDVTQESKSGSLYIPFQTL